MKQTWWSVVCNCTPENQARGTHQEVIKEDRLWYQYSRLRDSQDNPDLPYLTQGDLSTEERFMLWCFMHEMEQTGDLP